MNDGCIDSDHVLFTRGINFNDDEGGVDHCKGTMRWSGTLRDQMKQRMMREGI